MTTTKAEKQNAETSTGNSDERIVGKPWIESGRPDLEVTGSKARFPAKWSGGHFTEIPIRLFSSRRRFARKFECGYAVTPKYSNSLLGILYFCANRSGECG